MRERNNADHSVKEARLHSSAFSERTAHLVEKVLYKRRYADVVEVTVDQEQLRQELEPGDCIVTVSHSLTTLAPHDAWKQFRQQPFRTQTAGARWSLRGGRPSPIPTWASCIILTSLAPSPTAKVMGFSGDVFKRRTTWTQQSQSGHSSERRCRLSVANKWPFCWRFQSCYLSFLQGCHSAAQHSRTVFTDFHKELLVAP